MEPLALKDASDLSATTFDNVFAVKDTSLVVIWTAVIVVSHSKPSVVTQTRVRLSAAG